MFNDTDQPPDRAALLSAQSLPHHNPKWGVGEGITTWGALGFDPTGTYNADSEVIHVGPFLRWMDEQIDRHDLGRALLDVGWDAAGERRWRRWRSESVHPYVHVAEIEDALHRAGVRLVEIYPETDIGEVFTGWCPTCKDISTVDATWRCPWCDTLTASKVTRRMTHVSSGDIEYELTPEQHQKASQKRSQRYLTDEDLALARALYQDQKMTMSQVAQELWSQERGRRHTNVVRVEEALRRSFRRAGYATRTTKESNAGVLFRGKLCEATKRNGEQCSQSARKESRFCVWHDPETEAASKRRGQLAAMRAKREWVGRQLPMEPFVAWLTERKRQLALPPEKRRYPNRDESLVRLSRATGIDASTLIKWMRFENSKREPKHLITPKKVQEVLDHDGTTTFQAVYPSAPVLQLHQPQPDLAAAA